MFFSSEGIDINLLIEEIVALASVFITAFFAYLQYVKSKRVKKECSNTRTDLRRMEAEQKSVSILFESSFYNMIVEEVEAIFKNTKADRFLILFAVNGKTDFNHVTVVFEKTLTEKSRGAYSRYVKIKVDDHYIRMLKDVEMDGSVTYDVSKMPDCLLKAIYDSPTEQIRHSIIKFLGRVSINEDDDVLLYSSIATHALEPFEVNDRVLIKSVIDKVRSFVSLIKVDAR